MLVWLASHCTIIYENTDGACTFRLVSARYRSRTQDWAFVCALKSVAKDQDLYPSLTPNQCKNINYNLRT